MSSDSGDSDDAGFDDGLSTDSSLLGRIAEMRNMMNLATAPVPPAAALNSRQEPRPKSANLSVTNTASAEVGSPQRPPEPAGTNGAGDTASPVEGKLRALSLGGHSDNGAAKDPEEDAASSPLPPQAYDPYNDANGKNAETEEEEDEEDEGYTVTWSRGQLGILFKENARGEAVIRRVSRKSSSAEGLHFARVGDVLVTLNGDSVRGRAFQQIAETLRLPDFPLTLSFQPARFSDDDTDSNGNAASESRGPGLQVVRASDAQDARRSMELGPSNPVDLPRTSSLSSASYRLHQLAQGLAPPSPRSSFGDIPPPDEYDVVWSQGALGCGLKQRNGLPTIKSVTPGAAVDPSVQQIAPGDVMVLINGMITEQIGFRSVVETMQRAAKPIYMRFRRAASTGNGAGLGPPPLSRQSSRDAQDRREPRGVAANARRPASLGEHQYTIVWSHGSLGVQIKPRSTDGAVVISKLTGTGDPVLLSDVEVGDVFVRIAGLEVAHLGIAGTYEMLKTVQKPVMLVFERGFVSQPPPLHELPPAASPPPLYELPSAASPPPNSNGSMVPSFRDMRKKEAAADQYRKSFGGMSPQQRGDSLVGAADRRIANARQGRPSSFDAIEERRSDFGTSPGSRYSSHSKNEPVYRPPNTGFEPSPHDLDDGYTTDDAAGDSYAYDEPPPLPRFSDIEKGRVHTETVMSLPPPPAYLDVFSQSGRAVDDKARGTPTRASASPQRDGHRGSSQSSSHGRGQAPPEYAFSPSPGRHYQSASPPPPPQYSQPAPSYGQHSDDHIDRLRAQYIQHERHRNTQPPVEARERDFTQFTSYSDIDDSGVMAEYRRSNGFTRPQVAYPPPAQERLSVDPGSLPPPQLWIQWNEGPLGITFRRSNGQIVISRLTGAGYSQGLEQLRPGDWLVSFGNGSVGSYDTKNLRLSETMELIKTLPKPLDMCFIVR